MNENRRKPGPPKVFRYRRHVMLRAEELEALTDEAARQSEEYDDRTTISKVIRQCIRVGLNIDDDET